MKDGPNEYFLTSSERKRSEKKGEGQVEEKRREVRLCAIPASKNRKGILNTCSKS